MNAGLHDKAQQAYGECEPRNRHTALTMNYAALALHGTATHDVAACLPLGEAAPGTRTATPADVTLHLARHHWFVQFYPALAAKLGSYKAALFLGHALYWTRYLAEKQEGRVGWFFMSASQCQQTTGLSAREQGSVRKLLRSLGLIEERLAGMPATLHYRVNVPALLQWAGIACKEPGRSAVAMKAVDTWLCESVRFYKPLADCAGSVAGGLYLSLLVQKQREWRGADGFTRLPQQRISELLAWGTKTQRNAREKLKTCGLLQERQRGAWIRVDMDELMEQLAPGWHENDNCINNEQTSAGAMVKMEYPISTNTPAVHCTVHGFMQPTHIMVQMPVPGNMQRGRIQRDKARASPHRNTGQQARGQPVWTKGQAATPPKLPQPHTPVDAEGALVMPKELNAVLHDAARRTLACIKPGEQQMLLDELAGQMDAKNIANPIGYLHALVKKHKDGGLVPAFAKAVADERARLEKLLALQAQRENAAGAAPTVSKREVAEAKARLRKLCVAMKSAMVATGR